MKQVCIQQARKSVCDRPDLLRPARRGREADEAYPTGTEFDAAPAVPCELVQPHLPLETGERGAVLGTVGPTITNDFR